MKNLDKKEKTLLYARMQQLKDEVTNLKRESKTAEELDKQIRELERTRDDIEKRTCKELLERENESFKIQILVGDASKEDFDLEEAKALLEGKGLRAQVHDVLYASIGGECWTDCTLCISDCTNCVQCDVDCFTGCTTCYSCVSEQLTGNLPL